MLGEEHADIIVAQRLISCIVERERRRVGGRAAECE